MVGVSGDVIANLELLFILYNILGRKLYAFRDGYSTDIDRLSWDWISGCRRRGSRDQGDRRRCHGERTDSKGLRHNDTGWGATLTARADTIPNLASERFDSDTEQPAEAFGYPKCVVMNTRVTRKPGGIVASVINIPEPVGPNAIRLTCEQNRAPGRAPEGHGLLDILT